MELSSWQEVFDGESCMDVVRSLAAVFCGRLGPHNELYRLLQRADWEGVARHAPCLSAGAERYYLEAQVVALFKKAPFLPVVTDPEGTALKKFIDTEVQCARTNALFDAVEAGRFCFDPAVARQLHVAMRKISHVLGECPSVSSLKPRFTSGASTELKKKDSSIRNQLMADLACSVDMWDSGLAVSVLSVEPTWMNARSGTSDWSPRDHKVAVVRHGTSISYERHLPDPLDGGRDYGGNVGYDSPYCKIGYTPVPVYIRNSVLEYVPKTAFESRVIIKEPPLNKYVQTAYGDVIRDRLKEVAGIDIRRAQELHGAVARMASVTGALATLDLTSASDLNAYKLVQTLYPFDWYVALSNCRTSKLEVEGRTITLEKFSGMGNGFTFPLQTLTYWALVCACVEEVGGDTSQVYVYGDDIICPVEAVDQVRRLFTAVGLQLNMSKSFWTGGFRESCGQDWLFGTNVRPVYIKDHLSVEKLFILHNGFFRKGEYECAERVLSYIPTTCRLFGPDGFGDGHLLSHECHLTPHERTRRVKQNGQRVSVATGYSIMEFKTVASVPRFDWDPSHYDHCAILYNGSTRRDGLEEPRPRDQAYERELAHYLEDGMSISFGHAIRKARNAIMRARLPDEVVPSRQRGVTLLSDRFDVTGSVVASAGDSFAVVGMPLPGTEAPQIRTICIFG